MNELKRFCKCSLSAQKECMGCYWKLAMAFCNTFSSVKWRYWANENQTLMFNWEHLCRKKHNWTRIIYQCNCYWYKLLLRSLDWTVCPPRYRKTINTYCFKHNSTLLNRVKDAFPKLEDIFERHILFWKFIGRLIEHVATRAIFGSSKKNF